MLMNLFNVETLQRGLELEEEPAMVPEVPVVWFVYANL